MKTILIITIFFSSIYTLALPTMDQLANQTVVRQDIKLVPRNAQNFSLRGMCFATANECSYASSILNSQSNGPLTLNAQCVVEKAAVVGGCEGRPFILKASAVVQY